MFYFFPHYHLHPFNILQILKVQIFIYQHIAYILPSTYSKYLNETEFYSFGSFQLLMIRTMSGTWWIVSIYMIKCVKLVFVSSSMSSIICDFSSAQIYKTDLVFSWIVHILKLEQSLINSILPLYSQRYYLFSSLCPLQ